MYMTAVPAQPHSFAAGGKQASVGQLIYEQLESAFMLLFNIAHLFKQIGYIVKSFLSCGFGILLIHLRPLVVFAVHCLFKRISGFGYTSVDKSEPYLCVSLFIFCCGAENLRYFLIAVLFCLFGKYLITHHRRRLVRKCGFQVLKGL